MGKHSFLLLIGLALLGCGVDPAVAPREPVVAQELESFPPQDWRLVNNKFFLWREDMSPEHVSRALAISREIDDLDGQSLPLNRRRHELSTSIEPLKDMVRLLSSHLRGVKSLHDKSEKKAKETESAIATLEAQLVVEKDKPQPEPDVLKALQDQLLQAQSSLAVLRDQSIALRPVREKLERDLEEKKSQLEPLQAEESVVEAQQLEVELKGRARVDELMTVVDYYKDQPTAVTFQFQKDGRIQASISGWNLGDDAGPRNFSTEGGLGFKSTIRNVTYVELGGVFEMDVDVYTDDSQETLRETYHFRLARTKYDTADGRKFFGGEITRTQADGTVRRGLAKLVDRNN